MAASRNHPNRNSANHVLLPALAALTLALLACSLPNFAGRVDPVIQGPWADEIAPQGGRLSAPGLQLEVPAGALAEATVIQVDIAESDNPADLAAFDLSPDGLAFESPVAVTVSYAGLLPSGSDPDALQLIHASEAGEQPVAEQMLDREAEQISGTIEHFSRLFLRFFEDDEPTELLFGDAEVQLESAEGSIAYQVRVVYTPSESLWEITVTSIHEANAGIYQLFSEGEDAQQGGELLTEGTLEFSGECLFNYGDEPARSSFQGIAVPYQILSPAEVGEGDTVTVVINPQSQANYAFDDPDGSACPVFGDRQDFELLLESMTSSDELPPVPTLAP